MIEKIQVGDILELPKKHPCGGSRWIVLFSGVDIKLKCEKCGRIVMLPRMEVRRKAKKVGEVSLEELSKYE
ncbi:DUF951 domain-containing protein [Dictyoglomus thermophilum]|uniref:DUF951 domain-containing protein n=2 Tax=Dictyoglomus thermophilum TaxID=14 RepID=B5YDE0_DICT6|nr:DUF951 domain-containing protein [Dictyoglomus thermophilum]ACI19727.1 conserved hypothetical protein [Dictyoglomus thermophilum H-6-12]MCX7721324.1 DUF951 domain-containing protein [Dictyoglomus thermophilum]TYT22915.1 DUF951 domain-containing protein [Dictyoglomus thermophilum]